MMEQELVILVNELDEQTGVMGKQEAHEKGLLHRAFSVFIFNEAGALLLQQRALSKYHSPGLWTNTCCSHPRPGEDTGAAAKRRLKEEMGLDCKLDYKGKFIYKTRFENGLFEHELDHVFYGFTDVHPLINREEVNDFKWMSPDELKVDIKLHPQHYTYWLKEILTKGI